MRKNCTQLVTMLLLGLMAAALVLAQTNLNEDQGMKPYDSWHGGDLDSVSLTSGGLVLHIPLVSFPQRGNLDLGFSLRYSSKQWHAFIPHSKNPTPRWQPMVNTGAQIAESAGVVSALAPIYPALTYKESI